MLEEPPAPPAPPPAPPGRLEGFVARWCERPLRAAWDWTQVYSDHAWAGFALGAMAAMLAGIACLGATLHTGLGLIPDLLLALATGAVALLLTGGLAVLVRVLMVLCPWRFTFGALGALGGLTWALSALALPPPLPWLLAAILLLLAGSLGGAVTVLLKIHEADWRQVAGAAAVIVTVLALGTLLGFRLVRPGFDPYLRVPTQLAAPDPGAPDPGAPGLWKTATLTYGSGRDRRPEFGARAALKTLPVDAAPLLPELRGWRAKVRQWRWGFGRSALPLAGRVWDPDGKGPFPLVLAMPGTRPGSGPGLAYLGELLASRGFIFVAVDGEFLAPTWAGAVPGADRAQAWLLLKHLAAWRTWQDEPGNPFQGKVDLDRIALLGQDRGAAATALAAAWNHLPCCPDNAALTFGFDFHIQALVALAPVAGPDAPELEDLPCLVLEGSHDSAVAARPDLGFYDRARFTGEAPAFKAALWIYRADHSQFNGAWGRDDAGPPIGWLLSTGAVMPALDQQRIAKVFTAGFLEATLHGRDEYRPMFRDPRAAAPWLPPALILGRHQDSGLRPMAGCQGLDLTRAALPGGRQSGEELAEWRADAGHRAVVLGWDRPARFTLTLPPVELGLSTRARLVLELADGGPARPGRAPIDFTVELETADGLVARVPLGRVGPLQPAIPVQRGKWAALEPALFPGGPEPRFQTFELPLALFKEAAPTMDPTAVRQIRLVFDRTPRGRVLLEGAGFAF